MYAGFNFLGVQHDSSLFISAEVMDVKDPANAGGYKSTLYQSKDNGRTWTASFSDSGSITALSVNATSVYCAVGKNLYNQNALFADSVTVMANVDGKGWVPIFMRSDFYIKNILPTADSDLILIGRTISDTWELLKGNPQTSAWTSLTSLPIGFYGPMLVNDKLWFINRGMKDSIGYYSFSAGAIYNISLPQNFKAYALAEMGGRILIACKSDRTSIMSYDPITGKFRIMVTMEDANLYPVSLTADGGKILMLLGNGREVSPAYCIYSGDMATNKGDIEKLPNVYVTPFTFYKTAFWGYEHETIYTKKMF